MAASTDRIRVKHRLARWLVGCTVFLSVAGSGCRQTPNLLLLGSTNNIRAASHSASVQWAEPAQRPGLPNLHKVSDGLYRGAQPTAAGFKELQKLGIETVINLREADCGDQANADRCHLAYERIPMTAFHPKDEDVVRFLQIVGDSSRAPVFVHCKRGADRTGMLSAIYRIAVQGWTKDQALDEMTRGGFRFSRAYQNLVHYIRDLDIDLIKQRAGL